MVLAVGWGLDSLHTDLAALLSVLTAGGWIPRRGLSRGPGWQLALGVTCLGFHCILLVCPGSRGGNRPHLPVEECQHHLARRAWEMGSIAASIFRKYNLPWVIFSLLPLGENDGKYSVKTFDMITKFPLESCTNLDSHLW